MPGTEANSSTASPTVMRSRSLSMRLPCSCSPLTNVPLPEFRSSTQGGVFFTNKDNGNVFVRAVRGGL